jgi:hypothetical protein
MDVLAIMINLEGKKEDLQWIQVLAPLRRLSLNPNVCGLRSCFIVGYSDEKLPVEERVFLDIWDINSSKDYARD